MIIKIFSAFLFLFLTLAIPRSFGAQSIYNKPINFATELNSIKSAGTLDAKSNCSACASNKTSHPLSALISKDNNQKVLLTVLSEDEASALFKKLSARTDIPYGFPMDGCYARAHKMSLLLEDEGIISGKAFVEGALFVDTRFGEVAWSYHVAPVVLVKKGDTITPHVFDPSLFQHEVSFDEWKNSMISKSKSKLKREYFTSRFAYDPSDRTSKLTNYSQENLEDMEDTNKNYKNLLLRYNKTRGADQ